MKVLLFFALGHKLPDLPFVCTYLLCIYRHWWHTVVFIRAPASTNTQTTHQPTTKNKLCFFTISSTSGVSLLPRNRNKKYIPPSQCTDTTTDSYFAREIRFICDTGANLFIIAVLLVLFPCNWQNNIRSIDIYQRRQ